MLTNRKDAKSSGLAGVRQAIEVIEGDVVDETEGVWEKSQYGEGQTYVQIDMENCIVKEGLEPIELFDDRFSFRINTSDYKGSFWEEEFLKSCDDSKVLANDLVGKRIRFKKVTHTWEWRDGTIRTKRDFVIDTILVTDKKEKEEVGDDYCLRLATGRSVNAFKVACSADPLLRRSPELLETIKTGIWLQSMIKAGKLAVKDGIIGES